MSRLERLQARYATVGGQLSLCDGVPFDLQVSAFAQGSANAFAPPLSKFAQDYLKQAFVSALRADLDQIASEIKFELDGQAQSAQEQTSVSLNQDAPQSPEVPNADPPASEAPIPVANEAPPDAVVEQPVEAEAAPTVVESVVESAITSDSEAASGEAGVADDVATEHPEASIVATELPSAEVHPIDAPAAEVTQEAQVGEEAQVIDGAQATTVKQPTSTPVDNAAAEAARIAAKSQAVKDAADALVAEVADPNS